MHGEALKRYSNEEILTFFFKEYLPSIGVSEQAFLDDFVQRFGRDQVGKDGRTLHLSPEHLQQWMQARKSETSASTDVEYDANKNRGKFITDKIVQAFSTLAGDPRIQDGIQALAGRSTLVRLLWALKRRWVRRLIFWLGVFASVSFFAFAYLLWKAIATLVDL